MGTGPHAAASRAMRPPWLTTRRLVAAFAVCVGLLVALIAIDVFPYRSINHDEGVYLQQASMLLEGQLRLDPPVDGPFRPWFFVAQDGALYPKYAPVPAAMFALGMALGDAHLALAAVASATVLLTYALVAEVFDARTGAVSAVLLAATPLFLIQAAVFLPYLPTLALLLLFGWAYLRADRTEDLWWAGLAGGAIGIAFFARPYTAILFASPFVLHALWTIATDQWAAIGRQGVTAAVGLVGVGAALTYNAVMTGSPLVFPYQAFAPLDGPGFGRRVLLGHDVVYDLDLALASARIAFTEYVGRWSLAAPLGVPLAVAGLGATLDPRDTVDHRVLPIAGLAVTVPLGHLYFWGTLNAIGTLDEPGLGLLGHLGPFYHLALIVPTAVFGAVALVRAWDVLRPRLTTMNRRRSVAIGVTVVLVAGVGGATAGAAVADPIAQNRVVTASYETAYGPVEQREFENALVFLPTPYGPWLQHPFQYLRNEPDFDGPVVFAMDRDVFAVVDAAPDRSLYRYAYRGDWYPADGEHVHPTLRSLSHVSGPVVRLETVAGLPVETEAASIDLTNGDGDRVSAPLTREGDAVNVTTTLDGGVARLHGPALDATRTVPIDDTDTLKLTIYVETGGLDSFEYDLALPVRRDGGTVRAITPRVAVCRDVQQCGAGDAYVPGGHGRGIRVRTNLTAPESR